MERSEQINELAAALAKAQSQMKAAAKDRTNPHYKSKYADLSSVWDACRQALTSNGLSIAQMPEDGPSPDSVSLSTMLMHSSGQYLRSTATTTLGKRDAQGMGSALTYLRRYALAAMVGIVADEDDDGNGAVTPNNNGASYQRPEPARASQNDDPGPAVQAALEPLQKRVKVLRTAEAEYIGPPPPFSVADAKDAGKLSREINRSRMALAKYALIPEWDKHNAVIDYEDAYLIDAAEERARADDVPANL